VNFLRKIKPSEYVLLKELTFIAIGPSSETAAATGKDSVS